MKLEGTEIEVEGNGRRWSEGDHLMIKGPLEFRVAEINPDGSMRLELVSEEIDYEVWDALRNSSGSSRAGSRLYKGVG